MSVCFGPSRASGITERSYRLPKSDCFNKDALDRIVGTPTCPSHTVRDPQGRRQCITQKWVDENCVTLGCPRCEGRGTMSHSETYRKRFDAIEKKKLDEQLATRNAEPPPVSTAEMEVEQPQKQPSTGSSSAGPAPSGQEAVLLPSPSSHEVRMEVTELFAVTRPLGGVMRVRANEFGASPECFCLTRTTTSDGQHFDLGGAELSTDQYVPENMITCSSQTQTSPVCWRCQVEPKTDLYGDRTGKLMDPEKVVKGRLTELNHMNDHQVHDWIDEADIPKSTKIETPRWCDDLELRGGDECPEWCCRAAVQCCQTR